MATWTCDDCTTVYSVAAPRCPHCQSTARIEEDDMPKITVHGGASNAAADPETAGAVTEPPASTAPAPDDVLRIDRDLTEADVAEIREKHAGGASSPGNSSETSSAKPPKSDEPSETTPRSPARTTGSRSKKAPTDSSSAAGTDGDPAADTSASK